MLKLLLLEVLEVSLSLFVKQQKIEDFFPHPKCTAQTDHKLRTLLLLRENVENTFSKNFQFYHVVPFTFFNDFGNKKTFASLEGSFWILARCGSFERSFSTNLVFIMFSH